MPPKRPDESGHYELRATGVGIAALSRRLLKKFIQRTVDERSYGCFNGGIDGRLFKRTFSQIPGIAPMNAVSLKSILHDQTFLHVRHVRGAPEKCDPPLPLIKLLLKYLHGALIAIINQTSRQGPWQ